MTKEELLAKIKAEIERLYNGEAPKHDQQCNFDDGYFTGIDTIAQFIDTLESEKPINQERLDENIKHYIEDCGWEKDSTIPVSFVRQIASHFYDLGCRRTAEKYDEIEYNRQRAEESVPKDLEEAANESWQNGPDKGIYDEYSPFYKDGFIAGAKWQKEQMMKEAVKMYPCYDEEHNLIGFSMNYEAKGAYGQLIRIIIVKED